MREEENEICGAERVRRGAAAAAAAAFVSVGHKLMLLPLLFLQKLDNPAQVRMGYSDETLGV